MDTLQLIPVPNIPLISPGDDLADVIVKAMAHNGQTPAAGDIVVIAQKIVSKSENRFVKLRDVTPSAQALELAVVTGKDARQIEVVLWDTAEIIRAKPRVLIVEHRCGFICAHGGVDHSNVAPGEEETVLRLPADADASAARIRAGLAELTGQRPPVLIIDTHGRPWRIGATGVVIGLSGMKPVQDLRGKPDMFGVPLAYTDVGIADQLAGAATLVMGQTTNACPVVIARGLAYEADDTARTRDSLRPKSADLFR